MKPYHHIINIYQHENPPHKGNLYLGGVDALKKVDQFHQKNIKSILTVIDNWTFEQYKVKDKALKLKVNQHKKITIDDYEECSIYPFFEESHAFIKEQLQKNNVFVHCQMGISRSSSLVIAFLMKEFGWPFQQAKKHTKQKRPIIQPNEGFVEDLKRYQTELGYKTFSEK